jgi:hypothetical protein
VLLEAGADVGFQTAGGANLLHILQGRWRPSYPPPYVHLLSDADREAALAVLQLLLDSGVDCLAGEDGWSGGPLSGARAVDDEPAMRLMLADVRVRHARRSVLEGQRDCECDSRLLAILGAALRVDDREAQKLFAPELSALGRPTGSMLIPDRSDMLLLLAIRKGGVEVVQGLLDAGVSANQAVSCPTYDETPLLLAVRFGQMEIVRVLLDRGAELTSKHVLAAVSFWRPPILRTLLDRRPIPAFDTSSVARNDVPTGSYSNSIFTCPVLHLLCRHIDSSRIGTALLVRPARGFAVLGASDPRCPASRRSARRWR